MGFQAFKRRFRGREFWRSLNKMLFIGIYTLLVVVLFLFRQYMWHLIIALVVFIPSYDALYQRHMREMEKRRKANKVIEGWITHGFRKGERVYFYPLAFNTQKRLSEADLQKTKQYVAELQKIAETYSAKKVGLEKIISERLPKTSEIVKRIENKNTEEPDIKNEMEQRHNEENEQIELNKKKYLELKNRDVK